MENKEHQLEQLVSNYIRFKDVLQSVKKEEEELRSTWPKKPTAVSSLAALNDFYEADKQCRTKLKDIDLTKTGLLNNIKETGIAIIQAIPVKNVWVKVNSFEIKDVNYAVGYYYDVWGGGHSELAIREWSDDLPELTDRTYYP